MTGLARDMRGMTLVEVAIVGVLASLVMLALTGFYINSQGAWIEASTQAVTQREGTMILQTIIDSVHTAATAKVTGSPPTLRLYSFDDPINERCQFRIDPGDDRLHLRVGSPAVDRGPLGTSEVTRFDVVCDTATVHIQVLELVTSSRKLVRLSGSATLYNR